MPSGCSSCSGTFKYRHCEPTGPAEVAGPMTSSAKQSRGGSTESGLLRRFAPRNDGPLLRRFHVGRIEEAAGLASPQRGVVAVFSDQFAMTALLDDAAVLEHDEAVHLRDGGQPVRNRDHGLAAHQRAEA